MTRSKTLLLSLLFSAPYTAHATTISSFADWGISTTDLSSSVSDVRYITEDQHTQYLNPGYGGQGYDAEAIYTTWDNDYLYVAVMTGRKQNPRSGWAPGDIAFDLGSDKSFEYGLVTSNATGSYASTAGIGNPGDVYAVSEWNYGIWDADANYVGVNSPSVDKDHPTNVKSGDLIGSATTFSYESIGTGYGNWAADEHYLISAAIDLDLLGGMSTLIDYGFSIHWTPNCNNDWLQLDVPGTAVPTPAALALFLSGILGIGALSKRRKV